MERLRVGGKTYSDPDVLSLIRAAPNPIDPRLEVIRRARALNQKLQNFGDAGTNPRQRMEMLASLAGIKVAQMVGAGIGQGVREALTYREKDGSRQVFFYLV